MKIEKMTARHIPDVAKIAVEALPEAWSESAFLGELGNPSALIFVALSDEQVVGFGGVQIILGEAYITNIAVKNEHRRKGVARSLLNKIICNCEGCDFITLEVRVSNSAAISLYEKFGFVSQGIRKGFYSHPTEDANIMTLFLTESD